MAKKLIVIHIFFLISIVACDDSNNVRPVAETFLGQTPPGAIPTRFAPGIITDDFYPHSKLIISPRGDRIYWSTFLDTVGSDLALYYSDFDGNNLSIASRDTALDKYGIKSFIYVNKDKEILFGSLQPYEKLDGRLVRAVWSSEKTDAGWSTPQPIESTVDTNWASLGSPSINSAGDIYFVGRLEGESAQIFRTKYQDGNYQNYEPLPQVVNTGITLDPYIDFQDRYLLFAAANRPDNIGIIDLYIAYKDEYDNWTEPQNLGEGISTQFMDRFPMVTQNGNYLFFVTSHSSHFPSTHTHFYWMDAKVLQH
jgi:hypothetical protein